MISKIQIKRTGGSVIFEYETEDNSVKKTVEAYIRKEEASGKENVDLTYADLRYADLSSVDLIGANLHYADLSGANLSGAYLNGAKLYFADLHFADLANADLRDSFLGNTNLMYADLKETKLRNADLSNAILNSTKNIKYATCSFDGHGERGRQLLAIKINNETMLFCGCFNGNEAELRKYIEEDEEKYKASRLMALEMVLKFIEV